MPCTLKYYINAVKNILKNTFVYTKTYIIMEMHNSKILLRSAVHSVHFPKTTKMFFDLVFLVMVEWDSLALYGSEFRGRKTSQAISALLSSSSSRWGTGLYFRLRSCKDINRLILNASTYVTSGSPHISM